MLFGLLGSEKEPDSARTGLRQEIRRRQTQDQRCDCRQSVADLRIDSSQER